MNNDNKEAYSLLDYKRDCWEKVAEKISAGAMIVSPVVQAFLENPITTAKLIGIDYSYENNHKITRTSRIIKIKSKYYRIVTLTNNDTHRIAYPNQIAKEVHRVFCWKDVED